MSEILGRWPDDGAEKPLGDKPNKTFDELPKDEKKWFAPMNVEKGDDQMCDACANYEAMANEWIDRSLKLNAIITEHERTKSELISTLKEILSVLERDTITYHESIAISRATIRFVLNEHDACQLSGGAR